MPPLLALVLAADPTFPDPLVMQDGTRVTSAADWQTKRAPELRRLFQTEYFGAEPAVRFAPVARLLHENKATGLQEWAVTLADGAPPVHVLLALPAGKPKGLFVGLNFSGNHSLTDDPGVRVPDALTLPKYATEKGRTTAAARGKFADTWPLATIRERGYAVATAHYGEVVPDDPKATAGGLTAALRPKGSDTGAVMAWGWAVRRIAGWAGTRPELTGVPKAAVGHSRLGKAALVAVAFDTDGVFAAAVPSQAGTGGPSPNRKTNPKAETVKRITTAFPHWFAPKLSGYGDDPSKLPFDQHALIALCAPRPVFLPNAEDDQWADPPGQLQMLRLAEPVYMLLGADGLNEADPAAGRLAHWVRPGKHAMTPADWQAYLTWADRWVK
jgi:hypothetical protein